MLSDTKNALLKSAQMSFFGYLIDAGVVFFISVIFAAAEDALWLAILLPIIMYTINALYSLYIFTKRVALFYAFEKKNSQRRVLALLKKFKMPKPDETMVEAHDYLKFVMNNKKAPQEARNFSSQVLGNLESFSQRSKADFLIATVSLEAAMFDYFLEEVK